MKKRSLYDTALRAFLRVHGYAYDGSFGPPRWVHGWIDGYVAGKRAAQRDARRKLK